MKTIEFKINSNEKKEVSLVFLSVLGMKYDTTDIRVIYSGNKSVQVKRVMKLMEIKLKADDKFLISITAPNDEIEIKVMEALNKIMENNTKILRITA